MNAAPWIVAGLLAAAFLFSGLAKLVQSKEELAASPDMGCSNDFSPLTIKAIGGLEVAAAVGPLAPAIVDVLPELVPVAAVGLIALMVGAAITHARRNKTSQIMVNGVLIALAAFVAWGRLGPQPFA